MVYVEFLEFVSRISMVIYENDYKIEEKVEKVISRLWKDSYPEMVPAEIKVSDSDSD